MGFFRQHPPSQHRQADRFGLGHGRVDLDADPKPLATDIDDGGMADGAHRVDQHGAQALAAAGDILVDEHAHRLAGHGHGERVATEGRAMAAGIEDIHHAAPGNEGGDRQQAAAQRLADDQTVRPGALVLEAEHRARAAEAGLDFVENQQDAMRVADAA